MDDGLNLIRWLGPLGRLWMPVYYAMLGGVGVVAFRGQFSEECCCGSVQYGFCGDLDCVHLM